jgi:hypothetical protein
VNTSVRRTIGTLDLLDLSVISEFYGRDFLPYPFRYTQPSRYATQDEQSAYAETVPDRFHHGDLRLFGNAVTGYADADVRVECHVQHIPADTASIRMIAYRVDMSGYLAEQRADADAVDVFTIAPQEMGAVIGNRLGLTGPGKHQRVVVPEYAATARPLAMPGTVVVRERPDSYDATTIAASEVTAYSTVQSHWRPTRRWGPDRGRPMVVWIRVADDGEYLYAPDGSHAVPMTEAALRERIDGHVARDLALLQDYRDDE